MLSQLYKSAQNILNFGNRVLESNTETPTTNSPPTMVTTRRQSGNKLALGAQSSPVEKDVSGVSLSKKRRRIEPVDLKTGPYDESTTTPTMKKQKKLPLRSEDREHFERHSHFEVVIPVKEIARDITENSISSNKEKSSGKQDPMSASLREAPQNDNEGEDLIEIDPTASKARKDTIEDERILRSPGKKTAMVGGKRVATASSMQTQRKGDETPSPMNGSKAMAPKHKRFGSEDLAIEDVSDLVHTAETAASEDENTNSDDDAPEVVEKYDAQESARTATRIASKAAEKQNASIRKKRKERDSQLKEQAKSAKKNTKIYNNDGKRAIQIPADSINKDEDSHNILIGETPNVITGKFNETHAKASQDGPSSKAKSLLSKSNLPEFLPAEYLEENPTEFSYSTLSDTPALPVKPKKTKFIDPVSQKPRDRIKDGVVYRVSEARSDPQLAPKAVNNARSVKEAWLRGRIARKGGSAAVGGFRKVPNAGFFVNKR